MLSEHHISCPPVAPGRGRGKQKGSTDKKSRPLPPHPTLEHWPGQPWAPHPSGPPRQKAGVGVGGGGRETREKREISIDLGLQSLAGRGLHPAGEKEGRARGRGMGDRGRGAGGEVALCAASAGRAAVALLSQPSPTARAPAQYVFQGAILLAQQLVDLILLVLR